MQLKQLQEQFVLVVDNTLKTDLNTDVQKGINALFDGTSDSAINEFKKSEAQIKETNSEYNSWIDTYMNMSINELKSVNIKNLAGVKRAAYLKVCKERKQEQN